MRSSRWIRLALCVVVAALGARLVAVPLHLAFDEHHHPHDAAHHAQHGHGHGQDQGHEHGDPASEERDGDDHEHPLELLAPRDGGHVALELVALPAEPAVGVVPVHGPSRLLREPDLRIPRGRPPRSDAARGPPRA